MITTKEQLQQQLFSRRLLRIVSILIHIATRAFEVSSSNIMSTTITNGTETESKANTKSKTSSNSELNNNGVASSSSSTSTSTSTSSSTSSSSPSLFGKFLTSKSRRSTSHKNNNTNNRKNDNESTTGSNYKGNQQYNQPQPQPQRYCVDSSPSSTGSRGSRGSSSYSQQPPSSLKSASAAEIVEYNIDQLYPYVCTTEDPLEVRARIDSGDYGTISGARARARTSSTTTTLKNEYSYNVEGVEQLVDGTEYEKRAIQHVINRMDKYWSEEVLSYHDYEPVRKICKNRNELCSFWAAIGECENNRIFMLPNCAPACRLCLLSRTHLATNVS